MTLCRWWCGADANDRRGALRADRRRGGAVPFPIAGTVPSARSCTATLASVSTTTAVPSSSARCRAGGNERSAVADCAIFTSSKKRPPILIRVSDAGGAYGSQPSGSFASQRRLKAISDGHRRVACRYSCGSKAFTLAFSSTESASAGSTTRTKSSARSIDAGQKTDSRAVRPRRRKTVLEAHVGHVRHERPIPPPQGRDEGLRPLRGDANLAVHPRDVQRRHRERDRHAVGRHGEPVDCRFVAILGRRRGDERSERREVLSVGLLRRWGRRRRSGRCGGSSGHRSSARRRAARVARENDQERRGKGESHGATLSAPDEAAPCPPTGPEDGDRHSGDGRAPARRRYNDPSWLAAVLRAFVELAHLVNHLVGADDLVERPLLLLRLLLGHLEHDATKRKSRQDVTDCRLKPRARFACSPDQSASYSACGVATRAVRCVTASAACRLLRAGAGAVCRVHGDRPSTCGIVDGGGEWCSRE